MLGTVQTTGVLTAESLRSEQESGQTSPDRTVEFRVGARPAAVEAALFEGRRCVALRLSALRENPPPNRTQAIAADDVVTTILRLFGLGHTIVRARDALFTRDAVSNRVDIRAERFLHAERMAAAITKLRGEPRTSSFAARFALSLARHKTRRIAGSLRHLRWHDVDLQVSTARGIARKIPVRIGRSTTSSGDRKLAANSNPPAVSSVYLIGSRYAHHAAHSGYERAFEGVGSTLRSVPFRWSTVLPLGRIERVLATWSGNPIYSLGALLTELAAVPNVIVRRTANHHFLYGETDAWLIPLLAGRLGRPFTATLHLPEERFRELRYPLELFRNASRIIAVAPDQRDFIAEQLPNTEVVLLPLAVDTTFFSPTPLGLVRQRHRDRSKPYLLCVGGHLRDFDTLVASWRCLQIEPGVELRLVGVPGNLVSAFAVVQSPGVQLLSRVSDEGLRDLYRGAAAVVLPMHSATANTTLVEALACGAPIITTDLEATRYYLGETATYVPNGDVTALAAAMDDALRGRLATPTEADRLARLAPLGLGVATAKLRATLGLRKP